MASDRSIDVVIGFGIFMAALIVYDLIQIVKRQKEAIWVYLVLATASATLGVFYYSDPFRPSFSAIVLKLFGFQY